ncbi:BRCA1-associated RING domain protein 1 [Canna indica]|uniref:BRCA1-associated RING domain protein 1 n=1 Tax=Canna indica TaxID=4628 RepID=A0AAQ3QEM2_9LILI|nr:BRCA1-associated RING domain protein 1 [Canna indica]
MNATVNAVLKQGPQIDISDTKTHSGGSPDSGTNKLVDKSEGHQMHSMDNQRSSHVKSCTTLFGILNAGKIKHGGENLENKLNAIEKAREETEVNKFLAPEDPYSPQSSGFQKDSDYGSNDGRRETRTERLLVSGVSKRGRDSAACQIEDGFMVESKKQKVDADDMHEQPIADCAFCHTSRDTEASGPMLHYLDGEPMADYRALQPNVLHVHQRCIEWAPQVYFVGETAMNLEAELARASKIKCSHCGLKGAALGCYNKSCRRSYHVPCADDLSECRWDYENFLLLCPIHSSNRLPCDKSSHKKKISANNSICHSNSNMDQPSYTKHAVEAWTASPIETREWMLCGSALLRDDKDLVDDFVSLTRVATTSAWNLKITHVIAATDKHGACSRTLKVLMAILGGKWVLRVDWLKACMEAGHPVPEEPYEVSHDIHGSFDGPRNGRLRAIQKAPKLFSGLTFYFSGFFMPNYKKYLETLISAAGGKFLEKSEVIQTTFIVYNAEPPQGSDSNDLNEVINKRKEDAKEFAAKTCSRVIAHTWLLDSIASCNLSQNV